MVSADAARERFVVLDGMRGLAALAVIIDHVDSPLFQALVPGRYLAVDFFFVLSGFVLSHVYASRLAAGMPAFHFMRQRLVRLFPLYFIGTMAGALLAVILAYKGWSDVSWERLAASIGFSALLLPTPGPLSASAYNIYPFNGPAWTLFFELVVNLAFALVFLRLRAGVLGAVLAVSAAALMWGAFQLGGLSGGYNWETFASAFPRVFLGFFAGVLVHRLHRSRPLPALPAWAAFACLLAILAAPAAGLLRTVFDLSAALVLFPLLVAASAGSRAGGLAQAASWLGMLSYGIYILHVPIRDWLQVVLQVLVPAADLPGWLQTLMVAALAIAAAAVLDAIYDKPARRWLSRRRAPHPA